MADVPVKRQVYIARLTSSLRTLWRAQETLRLRNVRPGFLQYFFAFPLAMILINVQDHIWTGDMRVYGFPATTVLFLAFTVSAVGMLVFAAPKNITAISRLSAALTVAGLVPWLFLPEGYPSLVCASILMAGVGGCVSGGSFSFVFILNNTERFFGAALMLLIIDLVELGSTLLLEHPIVRKSLPLVLVAALCVSMFLSRAEDYPKCGEAPAKGLDPSILLALFIFFSYFAIRLMNFYAPAFQNRPAIEIWGVVTLLPVLLCVALQAVFRYSVWTMCNLYFIASIASHALWYAGLPAAAYFFAGMEQLGLFVSFYLIGSVTNKFCDFRVHKLLVLLCMTVVGALYVTSDLLVRTDYAHIVTVAVSTVLFIAFLLFSPAFSRHLFFSDWSEEFRKLHMTGHAPGGKQAAQGDRARQPSLDDTNLSLREKQVVLLLLQGLTLRQIAPELGLTFSTVSTYSKAIYKKLGINSRAELFLLFGRQPDDAAARLVPKK